MLFVVSPAKNLDYDSAAPVDDYTQPELLDEAAALVKVCRQFSPHELSELMGISDKLAGLNAARFSEWRTPFSTSKAKQAVFAFNGDVYTGLDAASLSEEDWQYGQKHMRILSGLYGVLKPLDLMLPYRLEMGTKLKTSRGKDLYSFWGDTITQKLNQTLDHLHTDTLINLASNEYFKAVKTDSLQAKVVTPVFKDTKNDKLKVISFYAKKARGLMARYIIEKKPNSVADLQSFDEAGYSFNAELSNDKELVFCRDEIS
ncbi:peroxide stress protein YaaA [Aliidiomarina sp.]|uniref:peroxide stress protein YaaA n=1 Tax=Aliidiomarina sp. TaxID=1872439 RepID=UPI003A4DA860